MKRSRDRPLFGPVPIYVVNEEQVPYAERITRKFVTNNIPAAVVQVFDRASLATHMQALAEGVTFHAVVIHPHSEATRTVAFIGANIESDTVPAYEDLDPDTAIDFIQQQVVIAEDRQRAKWYEQQEAKGKLRRKQAMLRAQLAKEDAPMAAGSGPLPPPPPPSILGRLFPSSSSSPAVPVPSAAPLPAVPPPPPPPLPAAPFPAAPLPPPLGPALAADALKAWSDGLDGSPPQSPGGAINIQSILNTLKRAKG